MTIHRQNPPALHATPGYHHVTIADARRTVYLAGQCPLAQDATVVPGDVLAQVDQVVANTGAALTAAGATPGDVVRTVVYVVTSDRTTLSAVWERFTTSDIAAAFTTASTLLGVAQLGYPGQLVELDVTAALG
ncbi:RidA family protein [Amycolatopsis saalfeldensis]|uniref:Enamine deaminase RidA, house cleaning of reactive enamine intermediates, YjgF/YER057c/UK114 family n=1 Tax=Amycolatopsis saalfeldensis TaxID=394193 RepID=A0A1H8YKV5_9PSEU|nr:RidA family protein [Amycolatopsis saalfeldensis]SEP52805.1 Enamine deaminase RidA, house cleaning of reactive enamine intermediates, YjgF/YER057c/UK114 family [Amycolatopsis saalfeldensis]